VYNIYSTTSRVKTQIAEPIIGRSTSDSNCKYAWLHIQYSNIISQHNIHVIFVLVLIRYYIARITTRSKCHRHCRVTTLYMLSKRLYCPIRCHLQVTLPYNKTWRLSSYSPELSPSLYQRYSWNLQSYLMGREIIIDLCVSGVPVCCVCVSLSRTFCICVVTCGLQCLLEGDDP